MLPQPAKKKPKPYANKGIVLPIVLWERLDSATRSTRTKSRNNLIRQVLEDWLALHPHLRLLEHRIAKVMEDRGLDVPQAIVYLIERGLAAHERK